MKHGKNILVIIIIISFVSITFTNIYLTYKREITVHIKFMLMIFPHDTILIAVVNAVFMPPDKRLFTHFMAPVGTQWKMYNWHLLVGTLVKMGIYWQTHLLTATLKSLQCYLWESKRNAWILPTEREGIKLKMGCGDLQTPLLMLGVILETEIFFCLLIKFINHWAREIAQRAEHWTCTPKVSSIPGTTQTDSLLASLLWKINLKKK